ncbi:hypothetical protein CERSUDRAFT_67133 [Gelatoporia subvermispora B]|uniref:Uncharacterized protein n=1 Tax=Ceriporiopsis subvermispora (strain B) TaxID=914234 RepID=M2QR81_CERS8|nr:hypothetical protein CERSUDRAFT_67133 [Gelatoporia subvermispora B]
MVPAPSNPPPPRAPAALAALTPSGTSPSQAGPSDRRPSDAAGSRWQPFKVPSVPSSADKSTPDTPPARELTAEEKEKVWFDRLDLINKGCALRLQCIKLKEEKRQFDTLLGRPDLIADEDRPVLEAQRAAHDATYAAKQNELERTVARLATVIYWPSQARDTPQQQQLPPDAALNLGAQISELKGLMGEVRDVLPSLSARRQDILAREEALRTLADGSEGSGHAPLPADITRVTRTELEVLLKKFDELEDRLAAVQNEIQQQHDDAIDEISALVAHKFEEMRLGGAAQAEGGKSIVEERLETAQAELEATGRDIDGLVAEVTELYGRIEQTTQENHTLKGENLALKAERDTLLQTIGAMRAREDERMQRVESGLRAVTLAMREHMARPTPPPFDTNMVVQHSQKIVTQHFRQELVPILTQLKDQVEQTLDNQNTVIWKEVIRKLQRTMEIMEGIQNWADRAGVGLTTVSKS